MDDDKFTPEEAISFKADEEKSQRLEAVEDGSRLHRVADQIKEDLMIMGAKGLEFLSYNVGRTLGTKAHEYLRIRTETFDTNVVGLENLANIEGSFIITPNHTRPTSKLAVGLGLHPDAIMIQNVVSQAKGVEAGLVAKKDPGEWGDQSLEYKKYFMGPIMSGLVKALGLIPVGKLPGSFNRELVDRVAKDVSEDRPIIMFPEGRSYDEFSEENDFQVGAGHFAVKHGIPIVPTFIKDCREWKQGSENSVLFGTPIYPENYTKQEMMEAVKSAVVELAHEASSEFGQVGEEG